MYKRYFILIIILGNFYSLYADGLNILDYLDEENENSIELYHELEEWKNNHFNLNHITRDKLLTFPLFAHFEMEKIIKERKQSLFRSWNDLKIRTSLDQETIELLHYFFSIREIEKTKPRQYFRSRLETHYPIERAYKENDYLGSSIRNDTYLKLNLKNNLTIRGRIEKDPGESNWVDHYAGFIAWQIPEHKLQLIFGNYNLNFGLGLTLSNPYGISPNGDPTGVFANRSNQMKGYSSSMEHSYFNGYALSKQWTHFSLNCFYSKTNQDATQQSNGSISSIYTSGYHRTENEQSKTNQLQEEFIGAHLSYYFNLGKIGCIAYKNKYSRLIKSTSIQRSYYDFKGTNNHVAGLYYQIQWDQIKIAGEAAQSRSKGLGILQTIQQKNHLFQWIIVWRYFHPKFQNPYSYCLTTSPQNIQGWYMGCRFKVNHRIKIKLYLDQWQRKWRTYTIPISQSGQKSMIQLNIKGSKQVLFKIRWIRKYNDHFKSTINENGLPTNQLIIQSYNSTQGEIQYKLKKKYTVKTHITYNQLQNIKRKNGFLCYLDIHGKPSHLFSLKCRWTLFDSENWDTRIYVYEWDLPGKMSIPFYYQKGMSQLLLLKWDIKNMVILSARYRKVTYSGIDSINEGMTQIKGNSIHYFGIQTEIKF